MPKNYTYRGMRDEFANFNYRHFLLLDNVARQWWPRWMQFDIVTYILFVDNYWIIFFVAATANIIIVQVIPSVHHYLYRIDPQNNTVYTVYCLIKKNEGDSNRRESMYDFGRWECTRQGWYFCYLGALMMSDAECSKEMKLPLSEGQYVSAGWKRMWQSHDIAVVTKVRLLKALLWSVTVYDCESWALRTADEKRIQAFEMMRGLPKIDTACVMDCEAYKWLGMLLDKAELWSNLLECVKARKLTYFWTRYAKQFRKFREIDNARNNTDISKRGRSKNNL